MRQNCIIILTSSNAISLSLESNIMCVSSSESRGAKNSSIFMVIRLITYLVGGSLANKELLGINQISF